MLTNEYEPVCFSIASWAPRYIGLINRVNELLPQLRPTKDILRLWLNDYPDKLVEQIPVDDRINVIRAGEGCAYPNIKSHGKLYGIQDWTGYWLTGDDDIRFPPNYVVSMVSGIERHGRKAICSYHGGFFPIDETGLINHPCPRRACERRTFEELCVEDVQCHILGNGIMGCYPSAIGLTYTPPTNCLEGDDENIAVWAQQNEVPLIRLAHRARWCRSETITAGTGALCMNDSHVICVNKQIKAWRHWHLPTIQKG
jgi:hypothetical protein